jgi:hypothetical protein
VGISKQQAKKGLFALTTPDICANTPHPALSEMVLNAVAWVLEAGGGQHPKPQAPSPEAVCIAHGLLGGQPPGICTWREAERV